MADQIMKMEIEVKLELEDYKKAYNSIFYTRIRIVILAILIPLVIIALILYFIVLNPNPATGDIYFVVLASLVLLLILMQPLRISNIIRLQYATSHPVTKKATWIISQVGLTTRTQIGTSIYRWEFFHKIFETNNYFLFFLNSRNYLILPKRFLDKIQLEELRSIILENEILKRKIVKLQKDD